jgi:hypothetical protein
MRIKLDGIAEKSAFPFKKKLFICSPSYMGEYCDDFLNSIILTLFDLKEKGIEFIFKTLPGDSMIERARNRLIAEFLNSDCTHILMIDCDQGWDYTKVYEMLMHDKEFIAGAVPVKDPDKEDYRLWINCGINGVAITNNEGLISTSVIGSAFIMLKRELFETIIQYNSWLRCESMGVNYYSFFEITHRPNFMGEDVTFCKRWTDLNGKIWIMPNINMIHIGKKVFKGNYHKFLLNQPQPENVIQYNDLKIG